MLKYMGCIETTHECKDTKTFHHSSFEHPIL